MKILKLTPFLVAFLLVGCANANLVGQRGNKSNTAYSLQDQRAARSQIKVADSPPAGAMILGDFSAERCHQYAQDTPPSDAAMLDDLILSAYAQGADGIARPRFERETAILKNCWMLVRGTATFFRLAR